MQADLGRLNQSHVFVSASQSSHAAVTHWELTLSLVPLSLGLDLDICYFLGYNPLCTAIR